MTPRWEEYARLILDKLQEHSSALEKLQARDNRAIILGAISGMVAGLVVSVAPHPGALVAAIFKAFSS